MTPRDSPAGRMLGHYRCLEQVGEGGMGVVYRAQDTRLNREVALKLIHPALLTREDSRARFIREARAASVLTHPNICTIHSIEEESGQLFLVLEYLEGTSLRQWSSETRRGLKPILDCLIQGAEGLAEAHRRGVVHRDIKPANLWVTPRGLVKIMDFGLAKQLHAPAGAASESDATESATATGITLGTTSYMSPEQALGQDVDPRSDIFSFGVVIYETATGKKAFTGKSTTETFRQILNADPPPPSTIHPDLPHELDRIVLKALRKDPDERYQTAADLVVDLKALRRELESASHASASHALAAARASGAFATAGGRAHPSRLGSAVLVLAALGVVVGLTLLGVAVMGGRPAPPQTSARPGRPTVAVMSFENRTGDERLNWYGAGASELVGVELARLPNVDVISKQRIYDVLNAMKVKGKTPALDASVATEVARRSGATFMVRGDALLLSGDLVLKAEVVDVASGRLLGAQRVTYVNEQNMLSKVDELGRLLAETLKTVR